MPRQPAGEGTQEPARASRARADVEAPFQIVAGSTEAATARRTTDRTTDREAGRTADREAGRRAGDRSPARGPAEDSAPRRAPAGSSGDADRRTAAAGSAGTSAGTPAARSGSRRRPETASKPAAVVPPPSILDRLGTRRVAALAGLGAAIVLIGAVAGYVMSSMSPNRYGARAEVYYEISQEKSTGFLREDRSLTTQLVLARSRAVLDPVATAHGMTTSELEDQLSVGLLGSSEVIRMQVEDASPERALALVNAVVDQYLDVTRAQGTDNARAYLEDQLAELDELIAAQREQIDVLASQATNPEDGKVVAAQSELQSLLAQKDSTIEQIDQLTVGQLTEQRIDLLTPGYVLEDPVSPRPKVAATAGALAAMVVAAALVAVIGRRWARR